MASDDPAVSFYMVSTQGQIRIADAALELGATKINSKRWLYDLVGKGLFSGYINWDEGVLYSRSRPPVEDRNVPEMRRPTRISRKGCGTM